VSSPRWVRLAVVLAAAMFAGPVMAEHAYASTTYSCPMTDSGSTPCQSPLQGTVHGGVTATGDGYLFDPTNQGTPGYVEVDNSSQMNLSVFPVEFSVSVQGVGHPSAAVGGDYDVVRGTPKGNWKLEVVARNNGTTARASCFFKGPTGKGAATGGPDLSALTGWHTITCVNSGSAITLSVDGKVMKTKSVATGAIPNPGPLLIGAKNTTGGDQYSGYAKDLVITAG
jgi:hypothetical protein